MSQPGTQSTSTSSDEVVEKSVRGAATTTLAGLLGRAAGLVTTLLVTHFVHKTEYGQANLALIIATVVNVLTLLAPQQALLTRRTLFAESSQIIQRFVVGSGVLVFGLLFGLGRPLLGLLHESGTLPLLQVYCAALFFERLALIPAVRLRYRLQFGELLRVDLLGDFVSRLLLHMDKTGNRQVSVVAPADGASDELLPWIEGDNFNPGYLMRDLDKLPKRLGDRPEWRHTQNYWREAEEIPAIALDGPEFAYR